MTKTHDTLKELFLSNSIVKEKTVSVRLNTSRKYQDVMNFFFGRSNERFVIVLKTNR